MQLFLNGVTRGILTIGLSITHWIHKAPKQNPMQLRLTQTQIVTGHIWFKSLARVCQSLWWKSISLHLKMAGVIAFFDTLCRTCTIEAVPFIPMDFNPEHNWMWTSSAIQHELTWRCISVRGEPPLQYSGNCLQWSQIYSICVYQNVINRLLIKRHWDRITSIQMLFTSYQEIYLYC